MNLQSLGNLIRLKPSGAAGAGEFPRFLDTVAGERSRRRTNELPANTAANESNATLPEHGRQPVLLGLDFGADTTRLIGRVSGVEELYIRRAIPSAVAMRNGDATSDTPVFLHVGEDALQKTDPRFKQVRPWQGGDIDDPVMARELARHVRQLMRRSETLECRAVVAEPATLTAPGRHHLRQALRGLFERVVFLPRAYLSGLALREELRREERPLEAGLAAVLVDMGAGSTEACLLGRRFPARDEIMGIPFGGSQVETLIQEALRQEYPAFRPSPGMIRSWKDDFGFVGDPVSTVAVKVPLDGVEREVVLTNSLRRGCEAWLPQVVDMIESLVRRGVAIGERPGHVFLTGGGSRLLNLVPALIAALAKRGHGGIRIEVFESTEVSLAALGGLAAAQRIREEQWNGLSLA
jgi:rod shape-determining protein MreB